MAEPKFAIGDQVRYTPAVSQDRQSGGVFKVVRRQPLEASGEQSYRIRSADGQERIASEHQLESILVSPAALA